MRNYLISVIIPIYNAELFVRDCLQSILEQTYTNLEVIVIDDGSLDQSASIVNSIKDCRIKLICTGNRGVSSARNTGLNYSTGDYIVFVDADDILERNFILDMLNCSLDSRCDVVFGNYKFLYQNQNTLVKKQRINPGVYQFSDLQQVLIDDGTLSGILFGNVWGAIYKSSIIKKHHILFKEGIKLNEDGIFNIELLKFVDKICVFEKPNYLYRQWKSKKQIDELSSDELDKATAYIKSITGDWLDNDIQVLRRNVSVVFWTAIKVGKMKCSLLSARKELKSFCKTKTEAFKEYRLLDFKKMDNNKKILIFLLKHHFYFTFIFLIKFVLPKIISVKRH